MNGDGRRRPAGSNPSGGAVAALVGTDCDWCGRAPLRETVYKGDRALVCPACGTPALRLF